MLSSLNKPEKLISSPTFSLAVNMLQKIHSPQVFDENIKLYLSGALQTLETELFTFVKFRF